MKQKVLMKELMNEVRSGREESQCINRRLNFLVDLQNTSNNEEDSREENNLDFFEKNAKESNRIEVEKSVVANQEKEKMERMLKEVKSELKQHSKELKRIEKKVEKEREERYKMKQKMSEAEHKVDRWRKNAKKLKEDLKQIEHILLFTAMQKGIFVPGESFNQFAKRCIKSAKKGVTDMNRIDALRK